MFGEFGLGIPIVNIFCRCNVGNLSSMLNDHCDSAGASNAIPLNNITDNFFERC